MIKARESNIELLRIMLMAIIIVWHCFVYGESLLENLDSPSIYAAPLLVFPVDCFVFISGFYGLKLNRMKLISMLGMLVVYSLLISAVTMVVRGSFDIRTLVISLFPVSTNYWWFFTLYIMLLIISPLLNHCDTWEKNYFKRMLILFGIFYLGIFSLALGTKMGCIGDLSQFIFIYLIGRYLRKFPIRFLISHRKIMLVVLYVISCLLIFVCRGDNQWTIKLISYNNPIVVLTAIEMFYIFKQMDIGTIGVVNKISTTVFASYIITESSLRYTYITLVTHSGGVWYGPVAILTILVICPIEMARKKIFNNLFDWITRKSYSLI